MTDKFILFKQGKNFWPTGHQKYHPWIWHKNDKLKIIRVPIFENTNTKTGEYIAQFKILSADDNEVIEWTIWR